MFTYSRYGDRLLTMVSVTKIFIRVLFFNLLALNFCWSVESKASAESSVKADVVAKSPSLVLKEGNDFQTIDFSKIWVDVSKKFGHKPCPLLTVEGECLSRLLQKLIQIADKTFPEYSSLISLAVTGFVGGLSCPGVDEKAACYAVVFLYEGKLELVFLFKALTNCMLVKNLSGEMSPPKVLKTISKGDSKSYCWQMYGNGALLKTLDEYLNQVFPFIYEEKNPNTCLKIALDFNLLDEVLKKIENEKLDSVKFCWDTFIVPDIKRVEIGLDVVNGDFGMEMFTYPQQHSPLLSFIKSLGEKSKQVRFLDWSSREVVQKLVFQNYSGLKNYVESFDNRIKHNRSAVPLSSKFKKVWMGVCPLIKDVLEFCCKKLTGNTQNYVDWECQNDLVFSKSFGFLEVNQLNRETLLIFIDDMIDKVKSVLKVVVEEKCFGCEFCKDLVLSVKKSVEKHRNCDIDQIFWKGKGNEAYCPVWFAMYKNYLLYSSDVSNLRRLIERMEEKKTFSYLPQNGNCFGQIQIDLAPILHFLGFEKIRSISSMPVEIICRSNFEILVNSLKIPNVWDIFSSKTRLPSPEENAKKRDVDHVNRSSDIPIRM